MISAIKKIDFKKPEVIAATAGLGVLLLVFMIIPHILSNRQLVMFSRIFILAVYGMSYDLLRGYTGFINLGQAIFFGSGVYMGVILLNVQNDLLFFVLALLIMTVYSLIGGWIISKVVLRTKTVVASAMVTLALGEIVRNIAERWRDVTGGQDGLPLGSSRVALDPLFESRVGAYYFAFAFLIVMTIVLRAFILSPTGRVMMAIRENEQRAQFLGFRTSKYKMIALLVSSVAAGYSGVFFSVIVRFANTDYLSITYTLNALVITLVGGTGTLYGAIIGSGFVTWIQSFLNDLSRAYGFELLKYPMLFVGSVYILLVIFMPAGIMGGIYKLMDTWELKRQKKLESTKK
ncbi:MAG: branched-chain amino acid ABC transporter permease [Spirochaetaceae bacterium]|nr:MAG: branched-chain amino acid ABC transporter permease [Spirochaetaceae bacterium]